MDLIPKIERFKKSKIRLIVSHRMAEFADLGRQGNKEWFSELCFCILTANSSAKLGIKAQKEIGQGFLLFSEEKLAEKLRRLGHRFWSQRAKFIVQARKYWNIKDILIGLKPQKAREWLVKKIKGLGWKEASHFLRNVGYTDFAILDRHILRTMAEYDLISKVPKQLSKRIYLEYEDKLRQVAQQTGLSLSELDLYLWFIRKGKILK
jgi:N-glycosylase/DNA lyase